MRFRFWFLLLIAGISFHCKKDEQPANEGPQLWPSGVVSGKITDEHGQLLTKAVVTASGNGTTATMQAANGKYLFDSLASGRYTLVVKREGYIETTASVDVGRDTVAQDFVLKAGTAYFNVLFDTLLIAHPFAVPYTVKIAANTRWVVSSGQSWITPSKAEGSGDDSVIVRVAASTEDTTREGMVVLQAGSFIKKIVIKQLANVTLKQLLPVPGNTVTKTSDSVALIFNQPVKIKSITPHYTYCSSGISSSYAGNKVTFSYGCAALGGDYQFTIVTENSLGDQYTFNDKVAFYEHAIDITGSIKNYFVNDADNSYWVITDHPNAMYKVDMTSFEVLHKYDLPGEPAMFTINPYNNKIYLAYNRSAKLYVLNQNGTTEQVIDITRDASRHLSEYYGPYIYPRALTFTKSGKGMIWLGDSYSDAYYWFIDATDNHRIWYEELAGSSVLYNEGKVNHDQTKLILSGYGRDATITTFDPQQMKMSTFQPGSSYEGRFIARSRKNDYVFSALLYSQLVANPVTGYLSQKTNFDNRFNGNADFCYQPGKEQNVYYADDGIVQVVDYATRTTPVILDAISYLKGTTATLDGKHLIFNRHDGNYNARLIQVPAAWFNY